MAGHRSATGALIYRGSSAAVASLVEIETAASRDGVFRAQFLDSAPETILAAAAVRTRCHRCFPRREATGAREPVKPVIEITAKVAGNLICSLEKYWRLT